MASCDANPRCDSLDSLFKDLSKNVDIVSKQIKEGESTREPSGSFSSQQYWDAVDCIFKKLSTETTKLSLALSKKPFPSPKNANAMVTEIEKAMLSLASIFYTLPLTQGKVLQKAFKRTVVNVLESLHCFAIALLDCVNTAGDSQRLTWTGGVWQATDFQMPKDNKTCVLKELASTGELVEDALGEIGEAKETDGLIETMFMGDDENDESEEGATWSEQDKKVIEASTGLVKATKTVVKKCLEYVRKIGNDDTTALTPSLAADVVPFLDSLVDLTNQISPCVDQFVCGIYAPVNYVEMKDNGRHLADLVEQILQFLRSSPFTDTSDQSWLGFLHNAVDHNVKKLQKNLGCCEGQEDGPLLSQPLHRLLGGEGFSASSQD